MITAEELSAKLVEYATLVDKLRYFQNLFRETHDYNYKRSADEWGKKVDQATEAIINAQPTPTQTALFK